MNKPILYTAVLAVLAQCYSQTKAVGTLRGSVADSNGAPVSGASVSYSRVPGYLPAGNGPLQLAPGESYASGSVLTDGNGA